jgi:hypothetical protein
MHALLCDRETPESATTAGSSAVHTFDEILAD